MPVKTPIKDYTIAEIWQLSDYLGTVKMAKKWSIYLLSRIE
ncbi:MAG: hypothetical protein ACUVUH_06525 [bacterium]